MVFACFKHSVVRLLKSMLITPNAPKREKQNFHGPVVHSIHRRGRNRAKTWRPASWNCRPQGTRSRALRRTSPTCWLTRAGSCQRAPAASLSPPAKTATAGLPRQYDAGGPSQPTGHLQGKKKMEPHVAKSLFKFSSYWLEDVSNIHFIPAFPLFGLCCLNF